MRKPREILNSPSGLYELEIGFSENEADKKKYECIIIKWLDVNDQIIDTFQTGASDFQKWAVSWYPNKDTIIMNSGDIGTFAYHLTNSHHIGTIKVTKDIDSIGDIIFLKKYSDQ